MCPTNVDPEDPRSYYFGVVASCEGSPERVEGEPVRQPVEHHGPLRTNRSGDLGADEWNGDPPGRRRRELEVRLPAWAGTSRSGILGSRSGGSTRTGSVFKKYKETGVFDKNEIYPYITEGIGEDFLPANVDFSVIDHFEKVTDKDVSGHDKADRARGGHFRRQLRPVRRWLASCSSESTSARPTSSW